MFPFLFFLAFFFSFCRIYRNFISLLVTVFSQAGYFSLACPSLSFGNLKKSQLLFRAVRGSIGVKNIPPGSGVGYNSVTEAKPSPGRGWQGVALTGVGRLAGPALFRPSSGPARPPSPRGRLRNKTLSRERVAGRSPDGCGAACGTGLVPPLFRPCGATFPQGKVKERSIP